MEPSMLRFQHLLLPQNRKPSVLTNNALKLPLSDSDYVTYKHSQPIVSRIPNYDIDSVGVGPDSTPRLIPFTGVRKVGRARTFERVKD